MRLTRSLFLIAAGLTLFVGSAGLTALMVPMSSGAASVPASASVPETAIAAAECPGRINEISRGFSVTLASLSDVSTAKPRKRCAAYRAHLEALTSARAIYAACLTGFAREDQVAQLELAARDWRSVIAIRCGN